METGTGSSKKNAPGKKPEKRTRKPRQKVAKPDRSFQAAQEPEEQEQEPQAPAAADSSASETAPTEAEPVEIAPIEAAPVEAEAPFETASAETAPVEAASPDVAPTISAESAQPARVSYQTISDAYGDYTKKSLEQTSSFFEQLATARSFNRAFELQTEYARQAYETFVAQSRRIGELHSELTRQRLRSFEGLMMGRKASG
jgi:chemotaxis protein histidine kinase CheA